MPEVIIHGTEGRLEGRYHQSQMPNAPITIVLHPHPEHGGNMNNKLVYSLYRAFAQQDHSVLRFNFIGVDRSEGRFDYGEGELRDAATALDWIQNINRDAPSCWVAGFSFGSWIAMQLLMRRPEITGFIIISPPVNVYDFSFISPCPVSGLIIQGEDDDLVPHDKVSKLATKLSKQEGIQAQYQLIKGADHFFKDKLVEANIVVQQYLKKFYIPQNKAVNE